MEKYGRTEITNNNGDEKKMELKMKAYDFDEDGLWSPGGGEQICFLGCSWIYPKK